jgi:hypothetical protein
MAPGPQDRVCIIEKAPEASGPASQCLSVTDTEAGRSLLTQEAADNDVHLVGVTPDGVATVHLVLVDGSSVDLPVQDNVRPSPRDGQGRVGHVR